MSMVGLGRQAFAYPRVREGDHRNRQARTPAHLHRAAPRCTQIMRDGGTHRLRAVRQRGLRPDLPRGPAQQPRLRPRRRPRDAATASTRPAATAAPPASTSPASYRACRRRHQAILRDPAQSATRCRRCAPTSARRMCSARRSASRASSPQNPVPIRELQGYVCRSRAQEGLGDHVRRAPQPTGKKVAVIGAGPAGWPARPGCWRWATRCELFDLRERSAASRRARSRPSG